MTGKVSDKAGPSSARKTQRLFQKPINEQMPGEATERAEAKQQTRTGQARVVGQPDKSGGKVGQALVQADRKAPATSGGIQAQVADPSKERKAEAAFKAKARQPAQPGQDGDLSPGLASLSQTLETMKARKAASPSADSITLQQPAQPALASGERTDAPAAVMNRLGSEMGEICGADLSEGPELSLAAEEAYRNIEGLLSKGVNWSPGKVTEAEAKATHEQLRSLSREDFNAVLQKMGQSKDAALLNRYFEEVAEAGPNLLTEFAVKLAEQGDRPTGQALLQKLEPPAWSHLMTAVKDQSELERIDAVLRSKEFLEPGQPSPFDKKVDLVFGSAYGSGDGMLRIQTKNIDAAMEAQLKGQRTILENLEDPLTWAGTLAKGMAKAPLALGLPAKAVSFAAEQLFKQGLLSMRADAADWFLNAIRGRPGKSENRPAEAKFLNWANETGIADAHGGAPALLQAIRDIYNPCS